MTTTTYAYRDGEWVIAQPQEGERYKIVTDKGSKGQRVIEGVFNTPVEEKRLTRLAFLSRFTADEYAGIDMASLDDPSADMAARTTAAKVRFYLSKVNSATYIDLTLQDTIDGVNQLVGLGLLSSVRAYEILNDPIIETERYKG